MAINNETDRSSQGKATQGLEPALRTNDIVAAHAGESDDVVAAVPCNTTKELEHGHDNAAAPISTSFRSIRRSLRYSTTNVMACTVRRCIAGAWPTSPIHWQVAVPFQAGATQAGAGGFVPFREAIAGDKLRGKPEKFSEHYAQATLFYDSQTVVERAHIATAFRFELSKVGVPAIRERMLSSLVNVSRELAAEVARGLGLKVPDGSEAVKALAGNGHTMAFVIDQFRHCMMRSPLIVITPAIPIRPSNDTHTPVGRSNPILFSRWDSPLQGFHLKLELGDGGIPRPLPP